MSALLIAKPFVLNEHFVIDVIRCFYKLCGWSQSTAVYMWSILFQHNGNKRKTKGEFNEENNEANLAIKELCGLLKNMSIDASVLKVDTRISLVRTTYTRPLTTSYQPLSTQTLVDNPPSHPSFSSLLRTENIPSNRHLSEER